MDQWHYDPAADLDEALLQRLRGFRCEPDLLVRGVRSLAAAVVRGWLHVYHRLTIVGQEQHFGVSRNVSDRKHSRRYLVVVRPACPGDICGFS